MDRKFEKGGREAPTINPQGPLTSKEKAKEEGPGKEAGSLWTLHEFSIATVTIARN